jgi:hypothetical protein
MSFYQGATSGLKFAHAIHVVDTTHVHIAASQPPLPVEDPEKASFPLFVLYHTSGRLEPQREAGIRE